MYRIRVVATGVVGSPYYMNHYFDGIDAESAASAVLALWDGIANNTTSFLVYDLEPEAVTINPATGQATASTPVPGGTTTGAQLGDILPTQVQALCSLTTGVYSGGRQIQGRINIGGLVESQQNNGAFLNPATVTALQAPFNTFLDTAASSEWDPVVWSRKNGTTAVITGMQVQGALATLRSRGGRG